MRASHKNILHLIATNFYGGPEKQIVEHLSRLDKNHFQGVLGSFLEGNNHNEALEMAKVRGLRHRAIPMSCALDVRALRKLIALLREEKVDLLCTHGYKSTVMGWWAAGRAGIPILAFSRGYTAEDRKVAFYEWLERQALKRVSGIICVSEGQKQRLASFGIHDRKAWVVHNGVEVYPSTIKNRSATRSEIFKRLNIPMGSRMAVSAGRLSPEKGHDYLVQAIGHLGEDVNDTYFVFCGNGSRQNHLETLARDLEIRERCRFPGFRRDIYEIFQTMDFMVLPSLTEGLPNVILEAFAAGKPVVATAVGGVPEIVEHGINGFLVPPARADLLAQAISKCLSSPELCRSMGEAGYQTVKSNFTFESQRRKLEKIYTKLLGRDGDDHK